MTLGAPFNRIADVCFPALMVTAGVACGSYTFLHILFVQRAPRLAFNFNYWSEQQFTRLWKVFAPIADKKMKALVSPLASAADKVVLDIGPGSGQNVVYYKHQNISKLYLVEPTTGLHPALREHLQQAGLADVATIIPCGVQDHDTIRSYGVEPASVDTIVTFSVLCSVPVPEQTCKFLYTLLKPGGQWLLMEHVVVDDKYPLSRWVQRTFQLVWPTLFGGCNLTRDTARYIREAGPWSRVEVGKGDGEFGWELLGHATGRMIK